MRSAQLLNTSWVLSTELKHADLQCILNVNSSISALAPTDVHQLVLSEFYASGQDLTELNI